MMPLVSVITPVYNTQKYLRQCLDAVLFQDLKEIEVICIDDGSIDDSPKILAEYAQKDTRVKVITFSDNKGASAARNAGLMAARGKYVGFVDSDDYPEKTFFSLLLQAAEESNAEIAKGNYQYSHNRFIDKLHNEMVRKEKTNLAYEFCSCIFLRDFLEENAIKFSEQLVDMEDPVFSFKAALCCNKVAIVDDAIINITAHDASSTAGIPCYGRVVSKCRGLEMIVDIANANAINPESYAYVTALWSIITLNNASKNRSIKARNLLAQTILRCWKKIRYKSEFLCVCSWLSPVAVSCFEDITREKVFYFLEDTEIANIKIKLNELTSKNKKLTVQFVQNFLRK